MGQYNGVGTLLSGGKEQGRVIYQLLVNENAGFKSAYGTLIGKSETLNMASNVGDSVIKRDDTDRSIRFVFSSSDFSDGLAYIAISGDPGPFIG